MNPNVGLQKELKEAYRRYAEANRKIELPSSLGIAWAEDNLLLRLNAESVADNVQTDAAAFEAWALILRLWLGEERVRRIELDWEPPPETCNKHYQRFLYRAVQFCSLFPKWFAVANPKRLEDCQAITTPQPILNVASGKASQPPKEPRHHECRLEWELIRSKRFVRYFGLKAVDRQFPVGLFAGKVNDDKRIFTGRKSAIDIVGLGGDGSFYIFELKADDNIPAGTISELLLYTALIREAARTPPRINFDHVKPGTRASIYPENVQQCTGIHAVMLVENLHPLFEHPDLLNTLNNAAEDQWNCEPGAKPVCFSKVLVRDFDKGC